MKARMINDPHDEDEELREALIEEKKEGKFQPMPEKFKTEGLRFGDIIRFGEYRDADTWIVVEHNMLFRPADLDYNLDIPLRVTKQFPNAIDHYMEVLTGEEFLGYSFCTVEIDVNDRWMVEKYGGALPEECGPVTTHWEEGTFIGISIHGGHGQLFTPDCSRQYIVNYLNEHKKPKSGIVIKQNGVNCTWLSKENCDLETKTLKENHWRKECVGSHSYWGPSDRAQIILVVLQKIYPRDSHDIIGPVKDVKLRLGASYDNYGSILRDPFDE